MSNPPSEATPRAPKSTSTQTPGVTQWFALHYAEDAEPSLPRTVFANEATTSDDGQLLRFTLALAGRAPYAVFEVPREIVLACNPHAELRAALTESFGIEAA